MKWHPNFQAESPIICKERSSVAVDSRQPSSNLSNVSSFYPLLAGFKVGITGGDAASWQANQQWFSKAHPRRRNHCSGGGVVSCFFFLKGCRFAMVCCTDSQQDTFLKQCSVTLSLFWKQVPNRLKLTSEGRWNRTNLLLFAKKKGETFQRKTWRATGWTFHPSFV